MSPGYIINSKELRPHSGTAPAFYLQVHQADFPAKSNPYLTDWVLGMLYNHQLQYTFCLLNLNPIRNLSWCVATIRTLREKLKIEN